MDPIEYLTRWRMLLATRKLSRGEGVGAVARSVGYELESAFSAAYKRVMGGAPAIIRAWRRLRQEGGAYIPAQSTSPKKPGSC